MVQLGPEQLLGHLRIAHPIGMGQRVGAWTDGTANSRKGATEELERIANIIKADCVRQLCVEHSDQMAPGRKASRSFVDSRLLGHLADQKWRNEIANLTQDFELVRALE